MLDILNAGFSILPDGEKLRGSTQLDVVRIDQTQWYTSGFE